MFRIIQRPLGLSRRFPFAKTVLQQRLRSTFSGTHHFNPPPNRTSTSTKLIRILGGLSIAVYGAYYVYWPKHTFPAPVAKVLRQGLWAESDKGDKDYQLALKYYIEALEKCDELELDALSDEYTGVQLKICEMFERLALTEDAALLYTEIASNYLDALTSPGKLPVSERPHMIQKDLRVIVKMIELNRDKPEFCKALLLTHILIAQEEVSRRSGALANLIRKDSAQEDVSLYKSVGLENEGEADLIVTAKNPEAWEPFRDELFNCLDLFVAICLATGDLGLAVKTKINSTQWMIMADCNPGEILLAQTNLGSLMYLNAEEYEAKEISIKRSGAEVPKDDLETVINLKDQCINLAIQSYESVLKFSKQITAAQRTNSVVDESIALSTYGLGVVNLHLGNHVKAGTLLREARVRAKGSGYTDLVEETERELQKLDKELDNLKKSNSKLSPGTVEMDVHLVGKHLSEERQEK